MQNMSDPLDSFRNSESQFIFDGGSRKYVEAAHLVESRHLLDGGDAGLGFTKG
jgi:hypothetical protein